jgi:hypothetical protein
LHAPSSSPKVFGEFRRVGISPPYWTTW